MKKNRILLIVLTGLLVGLCFSNANAITIDLTVSDSYIEVGETFAVEVRLDGEDIQNSFTGFHDIFLGFGFNVSTSGSMFSYTGYDFLGTDPSFSDVSDLSNSNNVAAWAYTEVDDLLLATLHFRADSAGSASLFLTGYAFPDFFDGLYYLDFLNTFDIEVSKEIAINAASAPVPEPSTILLLGLGLIGLVGVSRRKEE